MNSNALAVLQQLMNDPGTVAQLRDVLSLLPSNGSTEQLAAASPSGSSSASSPAVTLSRPQPRVEPVEGKGARAASGRTSASRRRADATAGASSQRLDDLPQQLRAAVEEADRQRRAAGAAEHRVREAALELQRLTQRVEQLSLLVQDQRREQQAAEDSHQLAIEELKHSFSAAMKRKDDVHEESLRQVLQSRHLLAAAKRFEAAVQSTDGSRGSGSGSGLRDGALPVNVRSGLDSRARAVAQKTAATYINAEGVTVTFLRTSAPALKSSADRTAPMKGSGSGVKRERSSTLPVGAAAEPPLVRRTVSRAVGGSDEPKTEQHSASWSLTDRAPRSATLSSGNGPQPRGRSLLPKSAARLPPSGGRSRALQQPQQQPQQQRQYTADVSASSASASRRRRTPRTPSLTYADRIRTQHSSASRSPLPTLPTGGEHGDRGLGAAPSWALATPTPLVAAVARQPAARAQEQRFVEQYGSAPGPRRAAGRVPLPQAQQATQGGGKEAEAVVPSTRSGASSVVAGPTRSPSPLNPKRGPALPRRFIFTGLKDPEPAKLQAAIEHIGDDAIALAGDLDEPPPFSTTHVVVRGTARSVKALCGMVAGKWLVPPEYIYNSLRAGFWLDEYDEGGLRIFPPPLKCQRFLITISNAEIREKLTQVVEYGGGEVVTSSVSPAGAPSSSAPGSRAEQEQQQQWTEKGVVVITSGDALLRYVVPEST